jgi:endonuclease III
VGRDGALKRIKYLNKKRPAKKSESQKDKRQRAGEIVSILEEEYPDARCHLNYGSALELLIGCILSAQCTDKMVNTVTPGLFRKFPTAEKLARADRLELEEKIHSCGFFRAKSKSIINCARALSEDYGGEVPRTMEELTKLAGVGRKTANVVLGNYYGVPGIIVDTHIKRLSNRLNLTKNSDPTKIEYDLQKLIPEEKWTFFSNSLGDHGRTVCFARKPRCEDCAVSHLCPSAGKF